MTHALILKKREFESQSKFSSAIVSCDGELHVIFKGAPEILLPYAVSYKDEDGTKKRLCREDLRRLCDGLAARGKRILLIGERVQALDGDDGFGALCVLSIASAFQSIISEHAPVP